MTLLGDALALAGWIVAFEDGLVIDPRPVYRTAELATLDAMFNTISQRSGMFWIVVAEVLFRNGQLRADWTFECTGIRRARLNYHVTDEDTDTMRAIHMGAA